MKRPRSLLDVDTGTFAVVFLWLMTIGPSSLLRDPGTFWHVKVGERILASGEAMRVDPFSATHAGQPWVPVGWLAECVLAMIHAVAGLDSLLLATAASLAFFFAWMARRASARGLQAPIAVLLVVLAVAASSNHFHPRPHLASIFLMAWTFTRLADFEAGRLPVAGLAWLAPMVALWTNLHGGVVGGLATMVLCAGLWTLAALVGLPSPLGDRRRFALVAPVGLACLAAVLVTPYGFELPRIWFQLLDSPVLPDLIVEHAPLDPSSASGRLLLGLALLYVAALAGVPLGRWRATWLVPLVWFALTCSRIRNGPLFAVTAVLALAEMYREIRWIRWMESQGSELVRPRTAVEAAAYEGRDGRTALVAALMVGACLLLQVARVDIPVIGSGWAKPDPRYWPVDMLPELVAHERQHPDGAAIFNEMLFGGYLIYYTPGLKVFIDDRCELYGDERLLEYKRAISGETTLFDGWTDRYGFGIALSMAGSRFDTWLRESPKWELTKENAVASLFRRRPEGQQR